MTNYQRIASAPLTPHDRFVIAVSKMSRASLVTALYPHVGTDCRDWSIDELRNEYTRHYERT